MYQGEYVFIWNAGAFSLTEKFRSLPAITREQDDRFTVLFLQT